MDKLEDLRAEAIARRVAREEIASLVGLMLGRIDDDAYDDLRSVLGEALRDFGATEDEPGPKAA